MCVTLVGVTGFSPCAMLEEFSCQLGFQVNKLIDVVVARDCFKDYIDNDNPVILNITNTFVIYTVDSWLDL